MFCKSFSTCLQLNTERGQELLSVIVFWKYSLIWNFMSLTHSKNARRGATKALEITPKKCPIWNIAQVNKLIGNW